MNKREVRLLKRLRRQKAKSVRVKVKKTKKNLFRDYITKHHIVNKINNGSGDVKNKLKIKRSKHIALHDGFGHKTLNEIQKEISALIKMFSEDTTLLEALNILERTSRAKENQTCLQQF